ncbi:MAG: heme exporter protein CcmB, partial [Pseudomonadota bacterium]
MVKAFSAVLARDLRLAMRRRGDWINPLVFFVIVVTLFPLGIGPDTELLRQIAPGILWVAALLATLLASETLFRADYDDGSLEQLVLSAQPLSVLALAKVCAHWLITGLPLLLLS